MDQQQYNTDTSEGRRAEEAKLHPMVVLQPGERIICDIRRHPFGIISMYVSAFFALFVVAVLAYFAPQILTQYGSTNTNLELLAWTFAGIFTLAVILVLWIATRVYWQNRWIVTDDSITQVRQNSLFDRRVSQLSMENLEDVTVDQQGIIQSMFGFGTLKAETAGEHSKFYFQYCPNPNKFARTILEVHETFLHQIRHRPQQVNPVMPISGPHYGQQAQAPYYQQPTDGQFGQQPPQFTPPPQPQQPWGMPQQQQPPVNVNDPETQPDQAPPQPWQQPQTQQPQQQTPYAEPGDTRGRDTTLPPPLQ